jgi:hypothetical protein
MPCNTSLRAATGRRQKITISLQIGHLINQLRVLSTTFAPLWQGKTTLRHRWRTMIAFLLYGRLRCSTLDALAQRRFQVRFT